MAELRSIGITSIKMGAVAGDGGMGTSLTAVPNIYKDSCELTQDDPEIVKIEAEEVDDPVEILETLGKRSLKFSIMDYTPATLARFLGGTATGTSPDDEWAAPSTSPDIEQSIEIVTARNVKIEIVRAKITAKLNAKLTKQGVALIDIVAEILTPTKAATAPITISRA